MQGFLDYGFAYARNDNVSVWFAGGRVRPPLPRFNKGYICHFYNVISTEADGVSRERSEEIPHESHPITPLSARFRPLRGNEERPTLYICYTPLCFLPHPPTVSRFYSAKKCIKLILCRIYSIKRAFMHKIKLFQKFFEFLCKKQLTRKNRSAILSA